MGGAVSLAENRGRMVPGKDTPAKDTLQAPELQPQGPSASGARPEGRGAAGVPAGVPAGAAGPPRCPHSTLGAPSFCSPYKLSVVCLNPSQAVPSKGRAHPPLSVPFLEQGTGALGGV